MNKINELIRKYCPDGVPLKKVKDVYIRLKGTSITAGKMKEIACDNGEIRIFAGGKTVIDAYEKDIPNANITRVPAVLVQSRGIIDVVYYERPFTFKNEMWAYTADDVVTVKFLYYVLKNNIQVFRDAASGMGALPQISLKVTEEFMIPVPPLEVQREIVRVLDSFTLLTAELTDKLMAEFTARKKQYEFYRDRLLTFDPLGGEISEIAWKKLGEICDIISGFPFDSTQFCNSGVKLLRGMNVKRGFLDFSDSNNKYWRSIDGVEKYLLRDGDIIVAMDGSLVGKSFGIVSEKQLPLLLVQRVARVRVIQGNVRYIYHCISERFSNYVDTKKTEGAVPHISLKDILNFQIPFPELQIQNRIAHVLDNFNAICTDLNIGLPAEIEDRQKQYEYYRDKLLSFKEVSESIGK